MENLIVVCMDKPALRFPVVGIEGSRAVVQFDNGTDKFTEQQLNAAGYRLAIPKGDTNDTGTQGQSQD